MAGPIYKHDAKLWNETEETLSRTTDLIVYDLETTGLSPVATEKQPIPSRIIEIGAVRYRVSFEHGFSIEKVDELHHYINPQCEVSSVIVNLTGLTNEFLAQQPTEEEVFDDIQDFFMDLPVSGYNNNHFDNNFMAEMYARYGSKFAPSASVDVMLLAKDRLRKNVDVENHKLVTIANYFGIEFAAHTATADAGATAQVLQLLVSEYLTDKKNGNLPKSGDICPNIFKAAYWDAPKWDMKRIYFSTDAGNIYYDLVHAEWGLKDSTMLHSINDVNMEQFVSSAEAFLGIPIEDWKDFRGEKKK